MSCSVHPGSRVRLLLTTFLLMLLLPLATPVSAAAQSIGLTINGVSGTISIDDATLVTATASGLADGASAILIVSSGQGCGGGDQIDLGMAGPDGSLGTTLGTYPAGDFSFQAQDQATGDISNCVNLTVTAAVTVDQPAPEEAVSDAFDPTATFTPEPAATEEPSATMEPPATVEATETLEPATGSTPTTIPATESPVLEEVVTSSPTVTVTGEATFQVAVVPPSLTVNNSRGPVEVPIGEVFDILAVGLPAQQPATLLSYGTSECGGMATVFGTGTTSTSGTISWQASQLVTGHYSYVARSGDITTGCADVSVVNSAPLLLTINESDSPVVMVGESANLRVTGLEGGRGGVIERFAGFGCGPAGSAVTLPLDTLGVQAVTFDTAGSVSFRAVLDDGRTSNCVTVEVLSTLSPVLSVNDVTGLIGVDEGDTVDLTATGVPVSGQVTLTRWQTFGCNGTAVETGPIATTAAGTLTVPGVTLDSLYTSFRISSAVITPPVESNCVTVAMRIPATTALVLHLQGKTGTVDVAQNSREFLVVSGVVSGIMDGEALTLRSYAAAGCSGSYDQGPAPIESVDFILSIETSTLGVASYMVVGEDNRESTCLTVNVVPAIEYTGAPWTSFTVNGGTTDLVLAPGDLLTASMVYSSDLYSAGFAYFEGSASCDGVAAIASNAVHASDTDFRVEQVISESRHSKVLSIHGYYQVDESSEMQYTDCVTVVYADADQGPGLTVNGSLGPVYAPPGTTFDLAGVGFAPDANLYLKAYSGPGCETLLASEELGSIVTVDGTVHIAGWVPEGDPVPPVVSVVITEDFHNNSNCVDIVTREGPRTDPLLSINNQIGSLTVPPGSELVLRAVDFPADVAVSPVQFTGAGCSGTGTPMADAASADDGSVTVGATAPDTTGVVSYLMQSSGRVTNCITVNAVEGAPASPPLLTVNNSLGPVSVAYNDPLTLFATGLDAGADVAILRFVGADCQGTGSEVAIGIALDSGSFLTDVPSELRNSASFRLDDAASNCVNVRVSTGLGYVGPGQGDTAPDVTEPGSTPNSGDESASDSGGSSDTPVTRLPSTGAAPEGSTLPIGLLASALAMLLAAACVRHRIRA